MDREGVATMNYRLVLVLITLLGWSFKGNAKCNPFWPDWECDFKNEDTHLWLNQPSIKWDNDHKFQTSIDTAHEFVEHYYNSVKTIGDDHIRNLHAGRAAAQELLTTLQTAQIAAAEADNDPWNLKAIYTDLICDVYYTVMESTGLMTKGDCYSDWRASAEKIADNAEAVQKIRDIVNNPFLVLGEEWGDVVDDMDRVRAEYNELETMARNLTGDQMEAALQQKFKNFEQMLINPVDATTRRNVVRPLIDQTLSDTVMDTLMATHANAKNLYGAQAIDPMDMAVYRSDLAESRGLSEKNQNAVGRLQVMELNNMGKSLQGQAWLDITEQVRANGYMMGLEMQSELERKNWGVAQWHQYTEELQPPATELKPYDGVPMGF